MPRPDLKREAAIFDANLDRLLYADRQLQRLYAEWTRLEAERATTLNLYRRATSGALQDPDGDVADLSGARCDDLDDQLAGIDAEIDRWEATAAHATERSLRSY
jgi:uncharacterized small protein (DUF1192 family)